MKKEHKKLIAQLIILVACIYFIIRYFVTHGSSLEILQNIQPVHIVLLVTINILINIIYSLKLLLILRKLGLTTIKYAQWLHIFLISRFINLHITQGAILYRSIHLKNQFGFSYTKSISLNTFFTWLESLLLFIYGLIIFACFDPALMLGPVNILLALSTGIVLVLVLPFVAQYIFASKVIRHQKIKWIFNKFNELADDITEGIKDVSLILKFTAYNFIKFALQLAWMHFCLDALNLQIGISGLILLVIIIQLTGSIRLIPGNLGITELISGYITALIGQGLGAGIIISVLQRVIAYLSFLLWGMFFIWPYHYFNKNKSSS